MLYEMTTGAVPFDGESDYEIMDAAIKGRYEPPTKRNPQLGPNIVYAIEKALRADPARRFESCSEMAAALKGTTQPPATKVADAQATATSEDKLAEGKGKASAGNASAGKAPAGNSSAGKAPAGKASAGNSSAGNASAGTVSAGKASAGTASAGTASAGNATSSKPVARKPSGAGATPVSAASTQPTAKSGSKLLGVILLVVALGIGGVAVMRAMKGNDTPTTNTGGGNAGSAGPLSVPSSALRASNGIRYKFLVEPAASGKHPATGYNVELRLTTFGDDGTPYPPRLVTTKLGDGDSPGIDELVPLLTPGAKLRGWIPLPGGAMTLVMDIELLSMRSRLDELKLPGSQSGQAPSGQFPSVRTSSRVLTPLPRPPPPPLPPKTGIGAFAAGAVFCVSGATQTHACNAVGDGRPWHFHGYVKRNDLCMACWDEASDTCEHVAGRGYMYLGSSCKDVPRSVGPAELHDRIGG
jgi:hypothetical protein